MTGVVLALAGLTAGDGGPGTGAASAPVRSCAGRWVGTCYVGFTKRTVTVAWDNGRGELKLTSPRVEVGLVERASFMTGGGQVFWTLGDRNGVGRCEWLAGQLRLYMGQNVWALRPAPREP